VRILCCANRDLASNYALNLLLPELGAHSLRVALSERVGHSSAPAELRGLSVVEQDIPNELVFPFAERYVPRDGRWLTFQELAVHCAGEMPQVIDLNAEPGIELLREFGPDLIITIRYGRILRPPAIGVPPLGVINLHSGILPAYRGILPTLYAIASGAADVGCTLHWIVDAGIDTGPIIAVARRPVERGHSLLWHVLSLYPLGVPLIVETVRRLTSGEAVPREPQAVAEGAYRSVPAAADVAALHARGFELFDPSDLGEILARYAPLASRRDRGAS
jgi:methionyl-tRNA formyltransferase